MIRIYGEQRQDVEIRQNAIRHDDITIVTNKPKDKPMLEGSIPPFKTYGYVFKIS
jgi:hypothetical protein